MTREDVFLLLPEAAKDTVERCTEYFGEDSRRVIEFTAGFMAGSIVKILGARKEDE